MAEHLGRALEGEGYSVAFAYDGEEALRLGKTDDFDVMLLDVMLPRMDGFAVLRKMREEPHSHPSHHCFGARLDARCRLWAGRGSRRLSDQTICAGRVAGESARGDAPCCQRPCRKAMQFEDLILRPRSLSNCNAESAWKR